MRRFVGCTRRPMVGEAVEAGDSTQVQGLSAVFNYPRPSSPWRIENWVYLPPPHRCCWHWRRDSYLEQLWGEDSERSPCKILPGTEMSLNNSAPGTAWSL